MKRICTVVGARPQFIKAAVVSKALQQEGIRETLIHTGQHYDRTLSAQFFDELDLPWPDTNLHVGSGPHGRQTGRMMDSIESYIAGQPRFDAMLLYGDTNSTIAAALVGAKLCIPIAHVEAGLRCGDRTMPEEINRVVTDHLSSWLFCPTDTAVRNLACEGIARGVCLSGDVMHDATQTYAEIAVQRQPLESLTQCNAGGYVLATVHRAANTDRPERLAAIIGALAELECPVVFPVHPRTHAKLVKLTLPENIRLKEPVGYLGMLTLLRNAWRVVTDSGGLQKEAYWHQIPCVTLRKQTEWVETLDDGWNICVDVDRNAVLSAVRRDKPSSQKAFGVAPNGTASACVARTLSVDLV